MPEARGLLLGRCCQITPDKKYLREELPPRKGITERCPSLPCLLFLPSLLSSLTSLPSLSSLPSHTCSWGAYSPPATPKPSPPENRLESSGSRPSKTFRWRRETIARRCLATRAAKRRRALNVAPVEARPPRRKQRRHEEVPCTLLVPGRRPRALGRRRGRCDAPGAAEPSLPHL